MIKAHATSTPKAVHQALPAPTAKGRARASGKPSTEAPRSARAPRADRAPSLTAADRTRLAKIESGATAPYAAVIELVSLVKAKKLSAEDALLYLNPASIAQLHLPQFAKEPESAPLATGLGVSNGCASGIAVFDPKEARARADKGESVILLVHEIAPDEVDEMAKVQGVVCALGDYASHTSVLARDYGIPAVNNSEFQIDRQSGTATLGDVTIKEGDEVSLRVGGLDKGEIFAGQQEIVTRSEEPAFREMLGWCQALKGIDVRANADLPGAVSRAVGFGASGVGLARTEHMFFGERRKVLQAAILSPAPAAYQARLQELEKFQIEDFEGIFRNAGGAPVAIRLMDPPLHEFMPRRSDEQTRLTSKTLASRLELPQSEVEAKLEKNRIFDRWSETDFERLFLTAEQESDEMMALAKTMGFPAELVGRLAEAHHEVNPMMGLRGVRLSVAKPEIYAMQVRAMFEAAATVTKEGQPVDLKIMVPLVNAPEEVDHVRKIIESAKAQVEESRGTKLDYELTVMIETPAAALRASELADRCDGFSFGTNDLTQFTLALSRGDAGPVLDAYEKEGLGNGDPFRKIDPASVGKLISVATYFARHCGEVERPSFPTGICGEQGADPDTLSRARDWGIDYVSVSPYRVATALVASAQENIKRQRAEQDTKAAPKGRGNLLEILAARAVRS